MTREEAPKEVRAMNLEQEQEQAAAAKDKKQDGGESDDDVVDEPSSSDGFARAQPWTKQITVRGVIVSIMIGSMFSVIAMKLNLTTGLVPNLNVSAALLAFVLIGAWTKLVGKLGYATKPFTRQENTMIQTCAVACYSITIGGGFASYLLGMNRKTYELSGVHTEGNSASAVKEPGFGWMTGYLFLVCFVGLFVLIPLRKVMIVDMELTYPSGLATAVLINGFHNRGDKTAKKQVRGFMNYFSISFVWALFKWFYAKTEECGFNQFPTFGLKAWKQSFYFDFNTTYVGAGMIVSHQVNLSLLFGAILSYGIMWPLINDLKGKWFESNLEESSMKSLYGYKVFLSVSLILGDGLYNFIKVMSCTIINIQGRLKNKKLRIEEFEMKELEDKKQTELFLREKIPMWIGLVGYVSFSVLSTIAVPMIFPQLKWYYVVVAYILGPSLAFCNAYGAGLTDINMAYNYGKVALFVLAAVSGKENGVVAALAGCGLVKSVVSVACILMQDFKTAFDVGNPDGEIKAPYALIYRNMAILGVEGFSALPKHCLQLCYGFFAFAVGVNIVRDVAPRKIGNWMPMPMVMGVPFLVGAYFAIDMCLGSLIVYVWSKLKPKKAEFMIPAVASGLICGEGLWTLPSAILAMAKVNPPMCMTFVGS
ncbi:Metal-nicotianamine transporter YSL1 [Linum perenne]